jgi:GT2 family glycosyltransferase
VLDLVSTTAPQTRHAVTAIIVAHDGARLLPGLVQALQAQTYPVERVVGVDTGSRDRSGAVLADLIGHDAVFGMDRSTGYGEAVAVALRHSAARRTARTDPNLKRVEWIWLLHDDCEPAPETLERLLRAASRDRSVVVLGPKVLDGQDRRVLREVGVAIDRAGRRITGIEPGEIDQGQHDQNRAVLAVGSAGMLIRRDVWDRLGGFDTRLKLFRDDVDFCWRVQGAGYRVHVVTDAVLYHRELSARRRRTGEASHPHRLDRRNALYVLAVNLPLLTMLRVMGGCVVGSLARALYFLLTKQLDLSAAQIYAVTGLVGHPLWLWRGRRRRAAGRGEGYAAARMFIPPGRTLSRLAESVAGLVSSGPPQASGGKHQAASEEPEDEQFVDAQSAVRRIIANPGVQLFVVLLVVALVAERRLLGTSPLGGGALVPAWGGASGLWQEYLAGFHAVGLGSTTSAPPYLAVVAALATVLGGQAWLAVQVLLLGCVPLAGLTAYFATRRLVTARAARLWLAASYALIPVAIGSVAAGRLGTAFAFVLLPLIGVSAGRMLTAPPRPARRAAWATGLLVALAAAFAPLVWLFGVAFAGIVLAARLVLANTEVGRWLSTVSPLNAAIVAVTPFVVLFPWSLHLLTTPSAFLAEAGIQSPGLTTAGLRPPELLLLSPGGPGLPPAWVTAGIGLAVLAALLPHRRAGLTAAGWCVAAGGFLGAVVVSRVSVTPAGGGKPVSGWPGAALAVAALGLLLAATPAAQWLAEIVWGEAEAGSGTGKTGAGSGTKAGPGRPRKLLAGLTLAVAATAPVLAAGYWVTGGVRGPVGSISTPVLPAFVSASSTSGTRYRTLILRPDGDSLDYLVVRQSDPILGEPELTGYAPAEQALSQQVAALGTPGGADAGDPGLVLGEFGIRWVILPGPVNAALAQRLDAAVGLVPLSKAPTYDLWQVAGPVARVRVVASGGTISTLPSQPVGMSGVRVPASGGTVVLAEPYGGWTATLNGAMLKPLAAPVDGWAQGFLLPPGGGRLVITRNNVARHLSLIAELIALLAVCVLALPGKRAAPAEEAQALAAVRVTQHSRQARAVQRSAGSKRSGRAGRRALQAARGGRVGRATAAGLGVVRRRAAPTEAGAEDPVPAGSGVGVLEDGEEPDLTGHWDQSGQQEAAGNWDDGGQWEDADQWGEADRWGTGPQPAAPGTTDTHSPARPRETGPRSAVRWDTGPQAPAPPTGPQPAAMAPWDSGDWGQAPDWDDTAAYGGSADRRDSARWDDAPDWDADMRREGTARRDDPARRDEPAPRAESAERHSHRAGRHGRPGRRRGLGDRSGKDEES